MSCGVGCRRGSDSVLLWLWRRSAATALIRPLAWEPPYAMGVAQEMAKRQKTKTKTKTQTQFICIIGIPDGEEKEKGVENIFEEIKAKTDIRTQIDPHQDKL